MNPICLFVTVVGVLDACMALPPHLDRGAVCVTVVLVL